MAAETVSARFQTAVITESFKKASFPCADVFTAEGLASLTT